MNAALVLQLTPANLGALRRHFLALPPEDLRLRFGRVLPEPSLLAYLDSIDFERDAVFGVFDNDLELVGAVHLGLAEDTAEIGVSVLPGHRRQGIGTALFKRCAEFARNHSIGTLFMHCLAENESVMRIARRAGMDIVTAAGEAEAYLKLAPADATTVAGQLLHERLALFDFALKSQFAAARTIVQAVADAAKGGDKG